MTARYRDRDDSPPTRRDETPSYYRSNNKPSKVEDKSSNSDNKSKAVSESTPNDYSDVSQKPVRRCSDCKKPPHMQCLHCSKYVCMECGQKHVALANEQVEVAQHVLNDKMSIIDRLSAAAKERVDADRNRIMKQAETEREQAFAKIDQIAELQKKQIRDKHTQLSELPLDEIPSFIQHMTNEMEYVSETNNRLFRVNSTLPKIQVEHGISTKNEKL